MHSAKSQGPDPYLQPSIEPAPAPTRRLKVEDLTDQQKTRYVRLSKLSIRVPAGPLRDMAIQRAALVWSLTPQHPEVIDDRECRILGRFLYSEGLAYQHIDEERALVRAVVDRWLSTHDNVALQSRRIYRTAVYAAGRVLYPGEYPAARAVIAPRGKGNAAAEPGTAESLYSIAPLLPGRLRRRLLIVLDLASGAGLRPAEIRTVLGKDIRVTRRPGGHDLVVVRVRRKGKFDRAVPVMDPAKARRIVARADEVGPSEPLMPKDKNGEVPRNAVNRVSEDLRRLGHPTVDALGLRHRWLLDLAVTPGVPAAALLALSGVSDLRVLVDRVEQLPHYSPEQLAGLLAAADDVAGGAA